MCLTAVTGSPRCAARSAAIRASTSSIAGLQVRGVGHAADHSAVTEAPDHADAGVVGEEAEAPELEVEAGAQALDDRDPVADNDHPAAGRVVDDLDAGGPHSLEQLLG